MAAVEAEDLLKAKGVPAYMYSFGSPRSTECLVFEQRGVWWAILNWERGKEHAIKLYSSEDAASRAFVARVMRAAGMSE